MCISSYNLNLCNRKRISRVPGNCILEISLRKHPRYNDAISIPFNLIQIISFFSNFRRLKNFCDVSNRQKFDLFWQTSSLTGACLRDSSFLLKVDLDYWPSSSCLLLQSARVINRLTPFFISVHLTVKRYYWHQNRFDSKVTWFDYFLWFSKVKSSFETVMINRGRTLSLTFTNINELGLTGVLGDLQQRTCANPNMLLEEIEFKKVKSVLGLIFWISYSNFYHRSAKTDKNMLQ